MITVLHQKRAYTHSGTPGTKGVHQNLLLSAHAYMYFVFKWDWMRTTPPISVRIQSHFNTKCIYAWTSNNEIWCTHLGQEVPKWVYALFWCKTVMMFVKKEQKHDSVYISPNTIKFNYCVHPRQSWLWFISPPWLSIIYKSLTLKVPYETLLIHNAVCTTTT